VSRGSPIRHRCHSADRPINDVPRLPRTRPVLGRASCRPDRTRRVKSIRSKVYRRIPTISCRVDHCHRVARITTGLVPGAEQFRVPDRAAASLPARGAIQGEVRDASDLVFHCASALTTKVRAGQAARVLPIVDVSRLGLWLARGVVRRGDRGGMRSRCASAGGRAGGGSARHGSGGSSCSTRTRVVSGQVVGDHMDPVAIRTALANRLQPSPDIARRFLDHTPHRVVTKSLAVGRPPMFLMMVRPADRTIRAGVCHSVQRSRFGSAVLRGPVQHSCWNAPCTGSWSRSGVHGCDAGGEDQMHSEQVYESERRRAGGSCRP
jgi:hypothetical protein